MLRAILEIVPDETPNTRRPGRVLRVIDIKEDGSGSYDFGNYKSKFSPSLDRLADTEGWRLKQVMGLPYKDFRHERLLMLAIKAYLDDLDNGNVKRYRYGKPKDDLPDDYEV